MMRTAIVSCLILVLLASGCALTREARIDRLSQKYPQWDQGTIEKVAEHRVEVGMTEEMVREAKGRPSSVTRDRGAAVWEYICSRIDYEGFTRRVPCLYVNFTNGMVTGIQPG